MLACSPSEQSEANPEMYPWASRQQEEHRLWDNRISTSKGGNLQHNVLMFRLCELEHSIEALRESMEETGERR